MVDGIWVWSVGCSETATTASTLLRVVWPGVYLTLKFLASFFSNLPTETRISRIHTQIDIDFDGLRV